MRRLAAVVPLLLAALPFAAPGVAGSEPPPLCRVVLHVTPERSFVGEQLLWELRIAHRRDVQRLDWARPLAFPSFRVEWLPGGAGDAPAGPEGEGVEVTLERRALFPARAGRLRVPDATLRCSSAGRSQEVVVPGAELEVEEPPAMGRPADWSGLVGPLEMEAYLEPARIVLGGSARLVVAVRGADNVWLVRDPLGDTLAGEDVDVFRSAPETGRDVGRTLGWRRYVRYDLVPRRTGELRVPSLSLAYFDPERGSYRRARTGPLRLAVGEAAPAGTAESAPHQREAGPSSGAGRPLGLVAAAGLAAAGTLLLLLQRRRGRRRGGARATPEAAVRAALREARDAAERDDAAAACAALARGLRTALGPAVAGAAALSAEELRERARDPEGRALAELLARVERLRFAPGLSGAELRALLSDVEALLPRS